MRNVCASATFPFPAAPARSGLRGLFAPVDIAWLVFFRVLFGVVMLWEVGRYFANNWIYTLYIAPPIHFTYDGFHWVRPWPEGWLYAHFIGLGMLAVFIALGLFYRMAAVLFFLGFTYVFLLEKALYLNHFYLIVLISFLMIFLPAHHALSLDLQQQPHLRSQTVPAWTLWLMRIQIGLIYFFGGVAKLNADWLRGEPMRMWLARRVERLPYGHLLTEEWAVYAFSYGGLLLDLLVFPALLFRRTRMAAVVLLAMFHLMNAWIFDIGIFPWLMLGATMIYFDPGWPRQAVAILRRWAGVQGSRSETTPGAERSEIPDPLRTARHEFAHAHSGPLPWRQRLIVMGLAVWFTVQCLLPLRHFAYPGNSLWTEEGHRFSWHMKLRDKHGTAEFFAVDPQIGTRTRVNVKDRLTRRQMDRVSSLPDMLLQMARILADEQRALHGRHIMICVESRLSLNGRAPQPLVDPTLDLGAVHAPPLAHWDWILPLTEPLPNRAAENRSISPSVSRPAPGSPKKRDGTDSSLSPSKG